MLMADFEAVAGKVEGKIIHTTQPLEETLL